MGDLSPRPRRMVAAEVDLAHMIELHVFRGVIDDEQTASIARLYGRADPKYADPRFVRHQFVENPYGWSLHAFAREGARVVGHCALLPLPARTAAGAVISGKFEALVVDEGHQSSTLADGRLIGLGLLAELYERAEGMGFAVLHDVAQAELGLMHRMHGAVRVPVPWSTWVGVGDPRMLRSLGATRAIPAFALAVTQRALRILTAPASSAAILRPVEETDEPLPPQPLQPGGWTVEAADMWKWVARSGLLAWVEEPSGGRALVRVPGPATQASELLDWRPGRRRLAGAIATVAALEQVGRKGRSVRVANPGADPCLRRAAHLLGLVPVRDQLMLYVKSLRGDLDAGKVAATPFFFATF